jgi:hypothetical protein
MLALGVFASAREATAQWSTWQPIDSRVLAAKTPALDPQADAEVLFWRVWVEDEIVTGYDAQTVLKHYVRIKVYTERGRDTQSQVDLTYSKRTLVNEVAGRTTKPDGTVLELKKDDIFERTVAKANGKKLNAQSFVLPGVETGSVIEYRWREVRLDHLSNYLRLDLQREIPTREVTYWLKPVVAPPYRLRLQSFQIGLPKSVEEWNGFSVLRFTDIPAFKEEPLMPPAAQVRPWVLVYYSDGQRPEKDKFWKETGRRLFKDYKSAVKVDAAVQAAVAEAVGTEQAPDRRLERLHEFCRSRIKRLDDDAAGLNSEERSNLKERWSPADTLRRGSGTIQDVNLLFAALATAAGFETRLAASSDRGDIFFDDGFLDDYFLSMRLVAVKVGVGWRFFAPSATFVPFGMLHWRHEGVPGLVSDPQEPTFVSTPISEAGRSVVKRKGTFRLAEDGTLEGEVQLEYSGHLGADLKEEHDTESPEEREKSFRNSVTERLSAAEVSDLRVENATDPVKPLRATYKVRVPGYAQRTGKRLFLRPGYFQRGRAPTFPRSERLHPVYFHFPWAEEDEVAIDLPEGFSLESPDAPAPLSAGDLSEYSVRLSVARGRQLRYQRKFFFGGKGRLVFDPDLYPTLKSFFDAIHKSDDHALTLRQAGS